MAPKVLFGGFLVTFEVIMLEIDDLWVNIDDKEVPKGIDLKVGQRGGLRISHPWLCP
jgi:hypothetical protein